MVRLNQSLFHLPLEEEKVFGVANLIYGTLTHRGIQTLADWILECGDAPAENIRGFDLGCGDGELIYHLQQHLPGSHWEGVEISTHRVNSAVRDVVIWQGDMLQESYRDYNVLHADNLCLEPTIADSLEQKIRIEFCGLYITYRSPQNLSFLAAARYIGARVLETSWGPHTVYAYLLS